MLSCLPDHRQCVDSWSANQLHLLTFLDFRTPIDTVPVIVLKPTDVRCPVVADDGSRDVRPVTSRHPHGESSKSVKVVVFERSRTHSGRATDARGASVPVASGFKCVGMTVGGGAGANARCCGLGPFALVATGDGRRGAGRSSDRPVTSVPLARSRIPTRSLIPLLWHAGGSTGSLTGLSHRAPARPISRPRPTPGPSSPRSEGRAPSPETCTGG